MKRTRDASLRHLNSFGIEARAAQLLELETEEDLQAFASDHRFDPVRDLLLGGGSNILFARDVEGTVITNRVPGRRILHEEHGAAIVEASAGENWHGLVAWTLDQGLAGIENLSLIPGLAGAAPIQNIGAYGVELGDVLESVTVLDLSTGHFSELEAGECGLGYRESRFKSSDAGRYMVTRIRIRLRRNFEPKLEYAGLRDELAAMGVDTPTARQVSDAVTRLRRRKLPDPAMTGNAGSFFKNPVVAPDLAAAMKNEHPGLPVQTAGDGLAKLSAAWLIEHCGWKGRSMGAAAVSQQHALVLVNQGNATGTELLNLADAITVSVKQEFGINLVPELYIIRP